MPERLPGRLKNLSDKGTKWLIRAHRLNCNAPLGASDSILKGGLPRTGLYLLEGHSRGLEKQTLAYSFLLGMVSAAGWNPSLYNHVLFGNQVKNLRA